MPRRHDGSRFLFALGVLLLWGAALLAIAAAEGAFANPDRYDLPLWIARHLPRLWLNAPSGAVGGGFRPATDAELIDFFLHAEALSALERDLAYARASGRADLQAERTLRDRRAGMEASKGPVVARLSGELSAVARDQGLDLALPLFDGARVVWPPVNFAYDLPPNLLIRSQRNKIELVDTQLLRSDLSDLEIDRIVGRAERVGDSALVVRVGGIATYPSVVEEDDTYADTLEVISHEWIHQYLFFHPLGIRYFASRDITTINETVANIAGQELAVAIRARFPLPAGPPPVRSIAPPPDRSVNFDRTMHELRLEVDALLARGNVAEAEGRMNTAQRFLAEHGYYVARINQAYFAFYGTYANTGASTSPLGPKLATVRRHYPTLGAFMHAVQTVESVADLNRLVAEAVAAPSPAGSSGG